MLDNVSIIIAEYSECLLVLTEITNSESFNLINSRNPYLSVKSTVGIRVLLIKLPSGVYSHSLVGVLIKRFFVALSILSL